MQSVSVSVHIAVLAVGQDAAPTQTVSELAAKAGHEVVARATVTDTEPAIRAQLTRWIEDSNVDVVIVSGGIESENASSAIKPLVTQTLPGFTDLFRYLAFQEIGASAMLSNAEAAQCGSTFVFVLPASAGAVRAAMEKLILPQLDSNTTPKNLVSSMPRVRGLGDDAVPVPIAKEKTAAGSGLTPKSPSRSSASMPVRHRAHTGANVIRKVDPDDPPTRPIDVESLEKQIALSEAPPPNDALTKQVDLSRLPKRPPGADEVIDDTDQIAPGDLPARNARLESQPIDPPSPAKRRYQRTEPSPVVAPPRPPAKSLLPDPPAPRGPIGLPDSGHAPVAPLPSIAPVPAERKHATEPPTPARIKATTGPFAVPAVIPKSPSGPMRKLPTEPPPIGKRKPTQPPSPPRAATSPPPPPPARQPTGPAPIVKPPTQPPVLPEVAAAVSLPASPPPRRSPSSPPRPPTSPPPRPPTQPPPPRNDGGDFVISSPLRRSGQLPSGAFNYPVARSGGGSKVLVVLGALAVLAIGFVVVVFVVPKFSSTAAPPNKPDVVVATPADAAVEVSPEPGPEFDMDTEPGSGSASGSAAIRRNPPNTNTRPPRGTTPPPSGPKPGTGSATVAKPDGSGAGSAVEPEDTVENAPNNPEPSASDCDEVACVLAKYDRPCCERYRPKESDIKPRTAGGLPAELDKSMVRAGIEKVKPRVVACGEKSSDKGTVKISVTVKPDGSVKDASIASSPNPTLGACVVAVMKKAEFGKSVAGGSFTYPFVF